MKINLPITTQRLIIDDFKSTDKNRLQEIAYNMQDYYNANKDTGYYCWSNFRNQKSKEEMSNAVKNFINKYIKEQQDKNRLDYHLAVRLKDGELIGYVAISFFEISEDGLQTVGDPGYFIDPKHHSKGYIWEALTSVLSIFFTHFNMSSITTLKDNTPSKCLIEKLGGKYVTTTMTSFDKGQKELDYYQIKKTDYLKAVKK